MAAQVHLVVTEAEQKCWGVYGPQSMMGGSRWIDIPASLLLRDNSEACSPHLPQVPSGIELQVPSAAVCSLEHSAIRSLLSLTSPSLPLLPGITSKNKLLTLKSLSPDVSGKT